jgi:hypothetical protein
MTKTKTMWESYAVSVAATVIGLALAYVVGCAAEGQWMTPSADMLPAIARQPLYLAGLAAAVVLGALLWSVQHRAR